MGRLFRFFRVCCTLLGLLVLAITLTPLMPMAARRMPVDWYDGDADVLVVLGGSMLVDGTGAQATLGYDSYLRCTYALWMTQRHRYGHIVLSGPNGLAETMAKYLSAHGVKPEQLLIENAAHTTFENATFVKNILDHQAGLPPQFSMAILTSDYHSRRAERVFQHLGMRVRVIPVPDLSKRAAFFKLRWNAFLDFSEEMVKFGFYKLSGRV